MANEKENKQIKLIYDQEFIRATYEQLKVVAKQEIDKSLVNDHRDLNEEKETLVQFKILKLTEDFGNVGKLLRKLALKEIVESNLGNTLFNKTDQDRKNITSAKITLKDVSEVLGVSISWLCEYRDFALVIFHHFPEFLESDNETFENIKPSNYRDIIPILKAELTGRESHLKGVNNSLRKIKNKIAGEKDPKINKDELTQAVVQHLMELGAGKNRKLREEVHTGKKRVWKEYEDTV
jgi:hypothetical protein